MDFYNRGGDFNNAEKSPDLQPLGLTRRREGRPRRVPEVAHRPARQEPVGAVRPPGAVRAGGREGRRERRPPEGRRRPRRRLLQAGQGHRRRRRRPARPVPDVHAARRATTRPTCTTRRRSRPTRRPRRRRRRPRPASPRRRRRCRARSRGAPARCVVPRLRGRSVAQAKRLLARSRCKLGLVLTPRGAKGRHRRVEPAPERRHEAPARHPRRGAGARAAPQALAAETLAVEAGGVAPPVVTRARTAGGARRRGRPARRRGSPRPAPRPARRAAAVAGRRGRVPGPAPPERRTARRAPRGRRARLRRARRARPARAAVPGDGRRAGRRTRGASRAPARCDRRRHGLDLVPPPPAPSRPRAPARPPAPASRGGSDAIRAVSVTFVPQPEGSSSTVPRARSPSQATVVSGSRRVMRISPNAPRCPARALDVADLRPQLGRALDQGPLRSGIVHRG